MSENSGPSNTRCKHDYWPPTLCPECKSELAAPTGSDRIIRWSTFKPTEASTATQLWIQNEVHGLYWHLPEGFKRTGGHKVYQTEKEIRLAMLRTALQRTFFMEGLLREEITRLNNGEEQRTP